MQAARKLCAETAIAIATAALAVPALAVPDPSPTSHLGQLSLEELGNLEITSVSRRAERLSDAPTSVFVITAADIRRSGAVNLPDVLRMAPNLHVFCTSPFECTVTARGFASESANKLLVLLDGRSVYSPLFSGVFWDVQDLMLEDVDRIEVISGPGSTLWGVNAVNGVINVITRNGASAQGTLASASVGQTESRVSARQGGRLSDSTAWRLYLTRRDLEDTETAAGVHKDDGGHHTQVGLRLDSDKGRDHLLLRAAAYRGSHGQPPPGTIATNETFPLGPITVAGGHVLGLWERRLEGGGALEWQAYADHTERTVIPSFADIQDILDIQLQHSLPPIGRHMLVWGGEYRRGWDRVDNSTYVAFLPAHLNQTWASLYAQDEITLDESLRLSLGARVEHNGYTGTDFLPTARLAWKWSPSQLLWAALSRTVRAPSRLDHDTFVPGGPPFILRGGPGVDSETARVAELGYRGQLSASGSLSATVYQADYDRLHTQEIDPTGTFLTFANGMRGRTRGAELWGSWQALPTWRLHAGFSRLWQDLKLKPGSNDSAAVPMAEGANPSNWWTLRSALDLGAQTELDLQLRHVGALTLPPVPSYTTLDLRLAWHPQPALELALAGRNLTGGGHGEFTDVALRTEWQRSWAAQFSWRF